MDRRRSPILLLLITIFTLSTSPTSAASFQCNSSPSKCQSLVDYISPVNTTATFAAVQTIYSIPDIRSLFGANNLPLSTPPNQTIPPKQSIKIPFPCRCRGGYGVSDRVPVYTMKKGDVLDDVAAEVFSGVVIAEEIVAVNNVAGKDLISVGERLWVPLPCNCDDVDGRKVVHYGHVAENGSSVEGIAERFGSSVEALMSVNGLKNGSGLVAGQVLDVPLRACNSSIRPDSEDSQLALANGTYAFAAHNCVQCNCDASNNWTLQCHPSGVKPSNWSTCPTMQCGGDKTLMLGSSTGLGCDETTCSYAGFSSNRTIFTSLDSTCHVAPSGSPIHGNSGGRMIGSTWWNFGLVGLVIVSC
ncbi:LysM domain-containing GPI-anchored protein 2 [Linum perenne]